MGGKVSITKNGRTRTGSAVEGIVERLRNDALRGDRAAVRDALTLCERYFDPGEGAARLEDYCLRIGRSRRYAADIAPRRRRRDWRRRRAPEMTRRAAMTGPSDTRKHRENPCLAWAWNSTILRQVGGVVLLSNLRRAPAAARRTYRETGLVLVSGSARASIDNECLLRRFRSFGSHHSVLCQASPYPERPVFYGSTRKRTGHIPPINDIRWRRYIRLD